MQLKQLLTDDRVVSPVTEVILMVAITVILAAVIDTFVLGLGQNVQSTPQASFNFDCNDSQSDVDITHNGGDRLEVGDNTGTVEPTGGNSTGFWVGTLAGAGNQFNTTNITAGSTYTNDPYDSGDTVRVVWQDANNESSATLGSQEAPA